MDRRTALETIGGSAVALAGCLSTVGLGSDPAGVVVTRLSIENYTRNTHEVALEVVSDGETLLSETDDIGPREGNTLGGQVIDADLPADPSEVVIRAEMGEQGREVNLAETYDEACSKVQVLIDREARLSIFSSNDGTECFEETPSETDTAGGE